jgi:hypothetical protein
MKYIVLVAIFMFKMGLTCYSQDSKHRAGFGAGAKVSRLILDDPELLSSYNTGLNLAAFSYDYKIKPKIRLGFQLDLMFNKFLLSKNSITETIKYTTLSVPFKISYFPIRDLPLGISSSIGASYLIKKQNIELIAPTDLSNFFGSYEGEIFFEKNFKNIILKPFFNYGHSITNLVSKESNQRSNINYSAFSFGVLIF